VSRAKAFTCHAQERNTGTQEEAIMKDKKPEQQSESNQNEKANPRSMQKSKFNEQEYERWSETLRSKSNANSK
jgi:hypothetical protein